MAPVLARRYGSPIHQLLGLLPSTINLPVGYITISHFPTRGYSTVNHQFVGILPSTINLPVGILPINKHLKSGLCWSTGSNGPGTNFLNCQRQRLCCMNLASGKFFNPTGCTASTWMVDGAATRRCLMSSISVHFEVTGVVWQQPNGNGTRTIRKKPGRSIQTFVQMQSH